MEEWIDAAPGAVGEGALRPEEVTILLRLAREVAHRTERRMAPLAAFLAGAAAGRASPEDRLTALRAAAAALERLLPGDPA